MADTRLPPSGTPCPQCNRPVIQARLATGYVTLDAAKTPSGQYAAWFAPPANGAPAGQWRAKPRDETWTAVEAYAVHACAGGAGRQMEIGAS